jgi:uncharacterized protein (DUF2384 family)
MSAQDDFERIRRKMLEYLKRHEIDIWLRTPHPLLDGRRPCDMINHGDASEVYALVDQLDSGAFI